MNQPATPQPEQPTNDAASPADAGTPPHRGRFCPRKRWPTLLLMLVVFLAGMVVGGGIAITAAVNRIQYVMRNPQTAPDRMTRQLTRRLDLTDEQAAQVHAVLEHRHGNLLAIRAEVDPRVQAELDAATDEVAAVLNTDQKSQWYELMGKLRSNWIPPVSEGGASEPSP